MSRRPTMPSVSWSTGTVHKEEEKAETVEKKVEEKKGAPMTAENYHAFELDMDDVAVKEKPVVVPKERKRVGMSLADYAAKYN